ncbi:GntR family transcriptional regulator [Tundrisphaera lichenicola]|uniref:GntR family transcriptional regulator n=1 Tax=Tundrisphaera lichenicola TaxID=2029860 RepID=UPI003EB9F175
MANDAPVSTMDAPSSSNGRASASLKERAYSELKRRILEGQLSPGKLLSERQLAGELKMSKTPVHAALERLESEGLVSVAAQQGIVVREVSPQDMGDHFEIREALEPFVVAKLAGRLTGDQIGRLERNLLENRRAVREGDVAGNVRLDAEFHLLLCEFLGNREIERVMGQIRERAHGVIHHISSRHPRRMAGSLAEHQAITDAILAGDSTAAAGAMTLHLRNGLQYLYDRNS